MRANGSVREDAADCRRVELMGHTDERVARLSGWDLGRGLLRAKGILLGHACSKL